MNTYYKISVVQAYINHMTGKIVQINPPTTQYQMELLNKAYDKAVNVLDDISLRF